jgi:ABC-type transport system involved in cytochrome c biogenesis permease subunit
VFALPLVLGLVGLAAAFGPPATPEGEEGFRFAWGAIHGGLLLLAAVGVCVGFLASVMYLVQAKKLKAKLAPREGLRLLSLERLEAMNRRAINLAFPLLTAGVLIGAGLMLQDHESLSGWADPKVLGAIVLWVVFALVLYLRYGLHLSGRRLALLTILAFALLILTLVTPQHGFRRF